MNRDPHSLSRVVLGILVTCGLSASGCIRPARLQYDYARSFNEAYALQVDMTRASVKDQAVYLSGLEGIALRKAVIEETSTEKTATAELIE